MIGNYLARFGEGFSISTWDYHKNGPASPLRLWGSLRDHTLFYGCMGELSTRIFFCKILIVCSALLSVCISLDYVRKQALNAFEYIILLLLATCSMLFLISSADMISMYLAIELQSLCFYVLAAFKRNSEFSTEAGLKYFVLGAFSSGVLLFGCSLIYGFTGITHFSELTKIFSCTGGNQHFTGALIGMIFVAVGFLFKITAVPFHTWAPDVYEGSPTSVTAFFAITPKIAILGLFVRLFESSFYDLNSETTVPLQLGTANVQSVSTTFHQLLSMELTSTLPWQKIFLFCSIASMMVGALGAMNQKKIKRLLAYSSIGHVGYFLIGLCCGTVEGIQALLINLIIYLMMTINIFAIILSPVRRDFVHSVQRIKYISDLSVLFKTNPILAITLAINLFSMAGLPPLAGFWGKYYLLFSAFSCELYLVAIVGGLATVLSCGATVRLLIFIV